MKEDRIMQDCTNCDGTGKVYSDWLGKELDHCWKIIKAGKIANRALQEEVRELQERLRDAVTYGDD